RHHHQRRDGSEADLSNACSEFAHCSPFRVFGYLPQNGNPVTDPRLERVEHDQKRVTIFRELFGVSDEFARFVENVFRSRDFFIGAHVFLLMPPLLWAGGSIPPCKAPVPASRRRPKLRKRLAPGPPRRSSARPPAREVPRTNRQMSDPAAARRVFEVLS